MDFSIIIVSWNVKDKLRENLKRLITSKDVSFEVIVVDNNSYDGTSEMVEQEFKTVKLIKNKDNYGFAKANNIALRQAEGDYLLLLNPDMLVEESTLSNLLTWLKNNEQADVVGCKLVDEHGLIVKHVRSFPGVFDQAAIALKLPHIFKNILDKYLRIDFDYSRSSRVDSIRGSFFCIRRKTYKILGGLDERYFVWFEEVDYCRQAKQNGLEVWYTPATQCIDLVGQSFKQLKGGKKQKYFKESMLKYFLKWHSQIAVLTIYLAWLIGGVIYNIGLMFSIKSKNNT
ncbi:MAG: glycosyltransferase family 2 protein [Patescibacteria group bacterium]|nr:glycosyltransferase family 2 protein [Patescibacteria group bacterium]